MPLKIYSDFDVDAAGYDGFASFNANDKSTYTPVDINMYLGFLKSKLNQLHQTMLNNGSSFEKKIISLPIGVKVLTGADAGELFLDNVNFMLSVDSNDVRKIVQLPLDPIVRYSREIFTERYYDKLVKPSERIRVITGTKTIEVPIVEKSFKNRSVYLSGGDYSVGGFYNGVEILAVTYFKIGQTNASGVKLTLNEPSKIKISKVIGVTTEIINVYAWVRTDPEYITRIIPPRFYTIGEYVNFYLQEKNEDLQNLENSYAVAIESGNQANINSIKKRLDTLKKFNIYLIGCLINGKFYAEEDVEVEQMSLNDVYYISYNENTNLFSEVFIKDINLDRNYFQSKTFLERDVSVYRINQGRLLPISSADIQFAQDFENGLIDETTSNSSKYNKIVEKFNINEDLDLIFTRILE